MADKAKPVKTVPENVVIGLRKENKELKRKLADIESELKNSKLDLDDDENVKSVRKHLLDEANDLQDKLDKYQEDLTGLDEREKTVIAKELVLDLKNKGVETTVETLVESEDMKAEANDLYAKFLSEKTKAEKKAGDSQESKEPNDGSATPEPDADSTETDDAPEKEKVYESNTPTLVKKQPKDMTDAEFDQHWATLNRGA